MGVEIRQLDNLDLAEVTDFLAESEVENLFLLSRIRQAGLDPFALGCAFWGCYRDAQLVSICHDGANLCVSGDDDEAIAAFVKLIGARVHTCSIVGRKQIVEKLYRSLSSRYGNSWSQVRQYRKSQPLMVLTQPANHLANLPQAEVVEVGLADFHQYFSAAVDMYTEELGISPLTPGNGYANYIKTLITNGRSFALFGDGQILFKADIGAIGPNSCQLQGVWVKPQYRGKGIGKAAIAAVSRICLDRYGAVSLYVNDFNRRARHIYSQLGYQTWAELATVLY